MNVAMPVIRNHTGADSYFARVAEGLRASGHEVALELLPSIFEVSTALPRLAYRCPEDADIVHSKAEYGFAFRIGGRPLVVTLAHSVFDPVYVQGKSAPLAIYHRVVRRRNVLRSFERAARVVTVSEHSRRRIAEDYGFTAAQVIYNGVDETRFRPLDGAGRLFRDRWDRRRTRLLFTGNLVRRKGADLLPRIMEALGDRYVLYYTSGFRSGRGLRPTANMRPLGHLGADELVAAYNECDIFLFPTRMEGFGYPVAEAMACGKPVVSSDASSMPELVEDGAGGLLCPVEDVAAFADRVRVLAADEDLRARMGRHNRQRIEERFTLARSVASHAAVFRDALGRRAT